LSQGLKHALGDPWGRFLSFLGENSATPVPLRAKQAGYHADKFLIIPAYIRFCYGALPQRRRSRTACVPQVIRIRAAWQGWKTAASKKLFDLAGVRFAWASLYGKGGKLPEWRQRLTWLSSPGARNG
jgi:hypothetical protein